MSENMLAYQRRLRVTRCKEALERNQKLRNPSQGWRERHTCVVLKVDGDCPSNKGHRL